MSDINNPEKVTNLFNLMRGLIVAASPKFPNEFNQCSEETWKGLAGFVLDGTVSIGAKFSRTHRLSDFQTLPRDQSPTTLFVDHIDPRNTVETRAGQVLELLSAPFILEDVFVFPLILPSETTASVRWPLSHARPTLVLDTTRLLELQ